MFPESFMWLSNVSTVVVREARINDRKIGVAGGGVRHESRCDIESTLLDKDSPGSGGVSAVGTSRKKMRARDLG